MAGSDAGRVTGGVRVHMPTYRVEKLVAVYSQKNSRMEASRSHIYALNSPKYAHQSSHGRRPHSHPRGTQNSYKAVLDEVSPTIRDMRYARAEHNTQRGHSQTAVWEHDIDGRETVGVHAGPYRSNNFRDALIRIRVVCVCMREEGDEEDVEWCTVYTCSRRQRAGHP